MQKKNASRAGEVSLKIYNVISKIASNVCDDQFSKLHVVVTLVIYVLEEIRSA